MSKLAIKGGDPVRTELFPAYNPIGSEEKEAVSRVLESGNLSQFLGVWHKDFYGGPHVQAFEKAWAEALGVKYAITVNSNTSGLIASMGACGMQPGDEVIVSPYTMSAGAIAPMMYGAVPVFADVDADNFGLSPESIEECITSNTKAILLVHIFGNPSRMDEIMAIAEKYNLKVIEDCAQSPFATYKDHYVGTIGDVGIFSLNCHKHIHTGEGGVITTNNDSIAEKLYLIRNHGEAVVDSKGTTDLTNIVGYNFRMTEIEAAIGIEQLKKLPALLETRIQNAEYLASELGKIEGITPPVIEEGSKHVYYLQAFKYDSNVFGVTREVFLDAIRAEIPSSVLREDTPLIGGGYVKPLYLQKLYQQRAHSCSFNCPRYEGDASYESGRCANVERLHFEELITHEYMRPGMSEGDMLDVINSFLKVSENVNELHD